MATLEIEGTLIPVKNRRIPHLEILRVIENSTPESRGLVQIYRQDVLPIRTRTIQLVGRKCDAAVLQTLLGYEVQASYKRIHCPDRSTAHYLCIFAELGCRSIRLPYDPTVTARILPELQSALSSIRSGVQGLFPRDHALQLHVMRRVYRHVRRELAAR